jgi:hypothetical protein
VLLLPAYRGEITGGRNEHGRAATMRHRKHDILEAVRRHAERALSRDGEQLTVGEVYLFHESDLRQSECTVIVKWT